MPPEALVEVAWQPDVSLEATVFRDLWTRGFFVTSGLKFGCDFLAYPGKAVFFFKF